MKKNLLLLVSSLLVVLVLLEVSCRLLGLKATTYENRHDQLIGPDADQKVKYGEVPNSTIRSFYPDDPRAYFDSGKYVDHKINGVGWRGEERPIQKAKGTFRILALGDSFLFGQGVKHDDLLSVRLENLLNAQGLDTTFEVINAGVSGFNSQDELELLNHVGLAYRPDMVLLFFVLNDVEPSESIEPDRVRFYDDYRSTFMVNDFISRHLYFLGSLRQRFQKQVLAEDYVESIMDDYLLDTAKWNKTNESLTQMRSVCTANNIDFSIIIFPFFHNLNGAYLFQPIHDQMKQYCREEGIDCLDLKQHFTGFNGPELWVSAVDQHPNEIAHKIAAEAVFKHLVGDRLRPKVY